MGNSGKAVGKINNARPGLGLRQIKRGEIQTVIVIRTLLAQSGYY